MENKYVIGILCALILIVGVFAIGGVLKPSHAELNTAVKSAEEANDEKWSADLVLQDEAHLANVQTLTTDIAILTADKLALESEKLGLVDDKTELEDKVTELLYEVDDTDDSTYLFLSTEGLLDSFKTTIDPDDFDGLVSDDFRYDGDRYDFEEVIYLSEDFKPFLNVDDFNGDIAVGIE